MMAKLAQHLDEFIRFKLNWLRPGAMWTLRHATLAIVADRVCFDVCLRYTEGTARRDGDHKKSWTKAEFESMQVSFLNVIDDVLKKIMKPIEQEEW